MLTDKRMKGSLKHNIVSTLRTEIGCATGSQNGSLYTLNTTAPFPSKREAAFIAEADVWLARMRHAHHNAVLETAVKTW